jgi:hypothetical protein
MPDGVVEVRLVILGVPAPALAQRCPTPCHVQRRVIGCDPAVAAAIRCGLIMDVAVGRAYYPAFRMIASVRCRD